MSLPPWPQIGETWWYTGPWTLVSIKGRFGYWRTPTPLDNPTGWRLEKYDLASAANHWIPPGLDFDAAAERYRAARARSRTA